MNIEEIAKRQHNALAKLRELLSNDFQNVNLPHELSVKIYQTLIDTQEVAEYYTKWLKCERIIEH